MPRRLLLLLAALTALALASLAGIASAASTGTGAQNRVGALQTSGASFVGLASFESPCLRPGSAAGSVQIVVGLCVAAEDAAPLYRGVASDHPGYADALQGNAYPSNPESTLSAEEHNLNGGGADSPFTSWTRSLDVAQGKAGADGAILQWQTGAPPAGAPWSFEWSPDVWGEQEVLIRGPIEGARVIQP